jgi:hypothetical protein
MAVQEEIFRFIYEQRGDQSIVESKAKVAALDAQVAALKAQFVAAAIAHDAYVAGVKKLAAESARAKAEVEGLEKAAAGLGRSGKGTVDAIQGVSRGVQDFVSASANGGIKQGFNAITNNVDQMTQGFARLGGASFETAAKIGGFATFAVVGLQLLLPAIEAAAHAMGLFKAEIDPTKTAIEALQERIKELEDKKIKVEVDRTEIELAKKALAKLTEAQEAYNALMNLKSGHERKSESAVDEVIGEAGADKVRGAIEDSIRKPAEAEARRRHAEAEAKVEKDLSKMLDDASVGEGESAGFSDEQIASMRKAIHQKNEDELTSALRRAERDAKDATGDLFAKGKAGEVGEKNAAMAGALDKAGLGELAGKVRARSPAELKVAAANLADWEHRQEVEETKKAERDKLDEEEKKAIALARQHAAQSQDRFSRAMLAGKPPTFEDVRGELKGDGLKSDDASTSRMRNALLRGFNDALTKLRGEHGGTLDDARERLRGDLEEKAKTADRRDAAEVRANAALTPEQKKQKKDDYDDAQADWHAGKLAEAAAKVNAHAIAASGTLDEQVERFLNREQAKRDSVAGLTGGDRRAAIAEARRAGDAIHTPEEAEAEAKRRLMINLGGATGADGKPLTDEQKAATAGAMIGGAKADLARRAMELQGRGLNAAEQGLAIDAELASALHGIEQRLGFVERGNARVMNQARQVNQRSNLRRNN